MADAASGDADAERRRTSEERDTREGSPPSPRGLDALSHDDNVVRSQVALLLGDAVGDPSPLFDLGRAIEDAAWRAFGETVGEDGKLVSGAKRRHLASASFDWLLRTSFGFAGFQQKRQNVFTSKNFTPKCFNAKNFLRCRT